MEVNVLQIAEIAKIMVGSQIIDIARILDLVLITFKLNNNKSMYFHIQCFIRIFDDNNLVICTQDLLRRSSTLGKNKKFDWAKTGNTLFDDTLAEYKEKLLSTYVKDISFQNKDIRINFENGMLMEVFVHITESDDPKFSENYRIFDDDESKEHYIV